MMGKAGERQMSDIEAVLYITFQIERMAISYITKLCEKAIRRKVHISMATVILTVAQDAIRKVPVREGMPETQRKEIPENRASGGAEFVNSSNERTSSFSA
jgi:hypothetical protein